MKSTHWRCDNCCGAEAWSDALPYGWTLITQGRSSFCVCSDGCLAEFAVKARDSLPMGMKVIEFPMCVVSYSVKGDTAATDTAEKDNDDG